MYLIFRLFTPPLPLTYLKYAAAPRATDWYAEAGPLSGVVPPIRTSVEVTPGGAAPEATAASASATNAPSIR